jgi:hypothetical protein
MDMDISVCDLEYLARHSQNQDASPLILTQAPAKQLHSFGLVLKLSFPRKTTEPLTLSTPCMDEVGCEMCDVRCSTRRSRLSIETCPSTWVLPYLDQCQYA